MSKIFFSTFLFLILFSCKGNNNSGPKKAQGTVFSTSFEEANVKFCLTGDTGMKTEFQKKIGEMLKEEKCDRIIILGDIIYPSGISSPDDEQIKTKFEDFYRPLTLIDKKPKVALINGNHDYEGNFMAWVEVAKQRPWLIMPNRYYMENVHGFCFYYLDSSMLKGASFDEITYQLEWFENVRKEMKETCKTEIVLTHHPYLSEGRHPDASGQLKDLYESLIVNKSDFHISGHSHILKDFGKVGKTQFIISGTGGEVIEGFQAGLLVLDLGLNDHTINYRLEVNPDL